MPELDFNALLDKPADEFKPAPLIPEGSYVWQVLDGYKFDKVGEKKTDVLLYQLAPVAPGPEIDQGVLAEALDGKSLNDVRHRQTFFLTPDAMHRLVGEDGSFAVNCGVDVHGKSAREVIEECVGKQVMGMYSHRPNPKDEKRPFGEITQFAPVG